MRPALALHPLLRPELQELSFAVGEEGLDGDEDLIRDPEASACASAKGEGRDKGGFRGTTMGTAKGGTAVEACETGRDE